MVDSAHIRRAVGEAGANPGRSRRCEGRRFRAERHWPAGWEGGTGGRPESEDLPARRPIEPLAEGRIRCYAGCLPSLRRHLSSFPSRCRRARPRTRRRKDPARSSALPRRVVNAASNALDALEAASPPASSTTTCSRPRSARTSTRSDGTPATGQTGWVFKVRKSPPVGADPLRLQDGDTVLWYWAQFGIAGGPKTLLLERAPAERTATASTRRTTAAPRRPRSAPCCASARAHRRHQGVDAGSRRLRRQAHGARPRDARRRRPLERAGVRRSSRCFSLALVRRAAAAGRRQRDALGHARPRRARAPRRTGAAGLTAMQALDRKAEVETRTADASSSRSTASRARPQRDWFYFVDGIPPSAAPPRSASTTATCCGGTTARGARPNEVPAVVGAFPQPFLRGPGRRRRPGGRAARSRGSSTAASLTSAPGRERARASPRRGLPRARRASLRDRPARRGAARRDPDAFRFRYGSCRERRSGGERCSRRSPSRRCSPIASGSSARSRRAARAVPARAGRDGGACTSSAPRSPLGALPVWPLLENIGSHPFWPGPIVPVLGELT